MKFLRLTHLTALTLLLATTSLFALDTTDIPLRTPSNDTPAILETAPALPADTQLQEPTGEYKLLADVVVAGVRRGRPDVKVRTVVRPGAVHTKTKSRLLVVYADAPQLTLTFASNCTVNSGFSVSTVPLVAAVESPTKADIPLPAWTEEVCASWTLLNHGWVHEVVPSPRTYTFRTHNNTIDVSYNRDEVHSHYRLVGAVAKYQQLRYLTAR